MKLLDDESLERCFVIANSRLNRERRAVGVNSYDKELGLNPIAFLTDCLAANKSASWLDLCCGRGRALLDAAKSLLGRRPGKDLALHGVDLVAMFDVIPQGRVSSPA